MQPLKARIYNYLSQVYHYNQAWTHKSQLEYLAKEAGYLGDNAGRRLRELVEEGRVQKRKAGKSLEYQYIPRFEEIVI